MAAMPPIPNIGQPNPRIGGGVDGDTWWTGGPNVESLGVPKLT